MADQPIISNTDLNEMQMFDGVFRPRTVTAAAGQTIAKYTVLGYDATNSKTIPADSTGTDGEDAPRFVAMAEIDNSGGGAPVDVEMQVLVEGEVDGSFLIFQNGTDTLDTDTSAGIPMRDALKTEGIITTSRTICDELDNQ